MKCLTLTDGGTLTLQAMVNEKQDFTKLKQICISNPRQMLQCNGAIPIHVVPVPGEPYSTILIADESF